MINQLHRLKWGAIHEWRRWKVDWHERGTHERRLAYALWCYRLGWNYRHLSRPKGASSQWWTWPIYARAFVRAYLRGVPLGWRKS